jgi:hypothetical protein
MKTFIEHDIETNRSDGFNQTTGLPNRIEWVTLLDSDLCVVA